MRHGSLFSGIGGFDLAAQWMGWTNVFHCEWNEFGQKVLKYHWPDAISYGDITKTDFTIHRGQIDVLTGGFPCQPYSTAGKRLGKEDDRHLWPEMLRAITEIQPRWIVGENVFGLINWNGGMVFDEVQADLEAAGYEVWPYVLPACAVNAPHRRDRVWFVAHSAGSPKGSPGSGRSLKVNGRKNDGEPKRRGTQAEQYNGCSKLLRPSPNPGHIGQEIGQEQPMGVEQLRQERERIRADVRGTGEQEVAADHGYTGLEESERQRTPYEWKWAEASRPTPKPHKIPTWDTWPTQPPVCSRNDGLPTGLAGITVSKHRNESIKAYGNAVIPQVVYQIFKAIEQYEKSNQSKQYVP